jgi:cell shape-determining protein MreD
MNSLPTILILAVGFVLVFVESTVGGLRRVLGTQIELLPSLMIYAGLTTGLPTITLLAICGGLWLDSLSANTLGISVLPLFLVGLIIQRYRGLILKDQRFAQMVIGASASAAVPVMTLLLLLNTERQPLVGWISLWQLVVMSIAGGIMTPIWFRLFGWLSNKFIYRSLGETSFRPDREIKRGRA